MDINENHFVVIMAGGKGERLWPLSTSDCPKQCVSLFGGTPLIAQSVERALKMVPPENVFIVTSDSLVEPIVGALPMIPAGNVVGEPMGRDTAAACMLGTALVAARNPKGTLAVLTADHVIGDPELFAATFGAAMEYADVHPVLATAGIVPTFASTGFGYIECGEAVATGQATLYEAHRFVEKPDAETAASYLESGHYFWNSGMFVWSVPTFAAALEAHTPALRPLLDTFAEASAAGHLDAAMAELYPTIERISIDYAVMEKADNMVMVKGTFPWSDVGSLGAVAEHFAPDDAGNTVVGLGQMQEAKGNIVVGEGRLTALLGVDDLMVIQTKSATLVCPRSRAQEVKALVHAMGERAELVEYL
jgi:mannose-1-phosphate guanylyltransferase